MKKLFKKSEKPIYGCLELEKVPKINKSFADRLKTHNIRTAEELASIDHTKKHPSGFTWMYMLDISSTLLRILIRDAKYLVNEYRRGLKDFDAFYDYSMTLGEFRSHLIDGY